MVSQGCVANHVWGCLFFYTASIIVVVGPSCRHIWAAGRPHNTGSPDGGSGVKIRLAARTSCSCKWVAKERMAPEEGARACREREKNGGSSRDRERAAARRWGKRQTSQRRRGRRGRRTGKGGLQQKFHARNSQTAGTFLQKSQCHHDMWIGDRHLGPQPKPSIWEK